MRIGKYKNVFAKSYEESYTTELFKIAKVVPSIPQPMYELVDLNNEPIRGKFYNFELVRVTPPKEFKIEKKLKSRRRRGEIEHFVKWRGYNENFNSWIKGESVRRI